MNIVEWIRSNSVLLAEAFRQLMYLALAFAWVQWTEAQQTTVLSAFSAILAIIVAKTTVASARVDSIAHGRVQDILASPEGVMAGTEGKGTGDGR